MLLDLNIFIYYVYVIRRVKKIDEIDQNCFQDISYF